MHKIAYNLLINDDELLDAIYKQSQIPTVKHRF